MSVGFVDWLRVIMPFARNFGENWKEIASAVFDLGAAETAACGKVLQVRNIQ